MTHEQKKALFEEQKQLLDTFLKTGALSRAQYDKSLSGLKEKMGIETESPDREKNE